MFFIGIRIFSIFFSWIQCHDDRYTVIIFDFYSICIVCGLFFIWNLKFKINIYIYIKTIIIILHHILNVLTRIFENNVKLYDQKNLSASID